jgi:hypothetical protein
LRGARCSRLHSARGTTGQDQQKPSLHPRTFRIAVSRLSSRNAARSLARHRNARHPRMAWARRAVADYILRPCNRPDRLGEHGE